MTKNKIFVIILVSTFIIGITGLLLVNFVISNDIFQGLARGFLLVFGFLLIFLCGLMLGYLNFLATFFKLLLDKNLIIENWCLCLKNKNCKIRLSWYKRLVCYQKSKIVFEIEAKNIVLYYLARIALGPVNFTSMNYIFIDLIANKFNKTIDAKAILKYINENFTFNKKDFSIYINPSLTPALPAGNKPEKKKLDINNASMEEINNLIGVNIIMAKKLIKKREELEGFKSVNDVIIFLRLKPHMADILREQICINPIKISPARIKRVEREVDL